MGRKRKNLIENQSKEKPEKIKSTIKDDPALPRKSLFRIEEVAAYFDCAQSTIYLWKEHGILDYEKIGGLIRIPRESILRCRARFRAVNI